MKIRNLVLIGCLVLALLHIVVSLEHRSKNMVDSAPQHPAPEAIVNHSTIPDADSTETREDGWSPGLGMTISGKPGIEVAPGMVIGYDGSVGFGTGF